MIPEPDPAFLNRILAEIDAQEAAKSTAGPARIEIDARDLERLIKAYAGIPATAMRAN
jgi:hypothetical protein